MRKSGRLKISSSLKKSVPEVLHNSLAERILKLAREFKRRSNSTRRVALQNMMYEKAIPVDLKQLKKDTGKEISCTRGCDSCCYQNVDLFNDEAHVLVGLINKGVWYNKEELEIQRDYGKDEYHADPRPCIFLKYRECQVYEWRPAVCRKYFVVSPASDCHIEAYSSMKVSSPAMVNSEIVYSAMGQTHDYDKHSSLAHMIHKLLNGGNLED